MYHTANRYYEDLIIGEYQYIDSNGVEQINTLSNINIQYLHPARHKINGSLVIDSTNTTWKCPECYPNEKRVVLAFSDNYAGEIIVRKIVIGNQQAISISKRDIYMEPHITGTSQSEVANVAAGNYVLMKQLFRLRSTTFRLRSTTCFGCAQHPFGFAQQPVSIALK